MKAPGLRQFDFQPCACCGRAVGEAAGHFYRVTVTLHEFDDAAINRVANLEAATGSPALASFLTGDQPLAVPAYATTRLVCGDCGLQPQVIAALLED
jgi:hypothetical protein